LRGYDPTSYTVTWPRVIDFRARRLLASLLPRHRYSLTCREITLEANILAPPLADLAARRPVGMRHHSRSSQARRQVLQWMIGTRDRTSRVPSEPDAPFGGASLATLLRTSIRLPLSVITAPRSSRPLLERLPLVPKEDRDRQRFGHPSIASPGSLMRYRGRTLGLGPWAPGSRRRCARMPR